MTSDPEPNKGKFPENTKVTMIAGRGDDRCNYRLENDGGCDLQPWNPGQIVLFHTYILPIHILRTYGKVSSRQLKSPKAWDYRLDKPSYEHLLYRLSIVEFVPTKELEKENTTRTTVSYENPNKYSIVQRSRPSFSSATPGSSTNYLNAKNPGRTYYQAPKQRK
jgi:hypothetical protein